MMKKIIKISLVIVFIPLILVSILTGLCDFYNKVGFIYFALVLNSIMFFITLNIYKKYKIYIPVIIVLTGAYLVFVILSLKNPYYGLIGILTILAGIFVNYSKWLYFLYPFFSYPVVFNLYGINRYTIELYIVLIILAIAYSIWLKYHKTKIYLYDNYGD